MSSRLSGVWLRVCCCLIALVLFLPTAAPATVCDPGDIASCRMSNGCPGEKECVGAGYWSSCQPMEGLGTAACTTSAQCSSLPGTAWCSDTGAIVACKASTEVCNGCDDDLNGKVDDAPGQGAHTLTQACTNACGVAGTQSCNGNPWGGCYVATEVCNSCDENLDGILNNAPGQGANTLTRACNPNSCSQGGVETCTSTGWSGVCTGCGGAASCTNSCGATGTATCDSACQVSACSTPNEVCNNCDDNGNGVADEGLSCQPCDL